jgi:hypothetical protein
MAEYLLHSAILKETQHGRGNDVLVASRKSQEADASSSSMSESKKLMRQTEECAVPVEVRSKSCNL